MNHEEAPYLEEISKQYEKISELYSSLSLKHVYDPVEGNRRYVGEDIDAVVDAFAAYAGLTTDEVDSLKEDMRSGEIDFFHLLSDDAGMPDSELALLYIISRPFFRSLRQSANMDHTYWQGGRCPVCSGVPSLSILEKEQQRQYVCSFCGSIGYYQRIGCPSCLTEDGRDITVITIDGVEGMRADACEKCRRYSKSFDGSLASDHTPDELDIMSMPLDIIVQEKGFQRNAPNPLGLKKMA